MSLLLLIATLCAGSALSQVQVPCFGEGCVNVTVYLGPRWGSRVIMMPRARNTTLPSVNSTAFKLDEEVGVSEDRFGSRNEQYHHSQHRPVSQDGQTQVDFMDEESSVNRFPTTQNSLQSTRNIYKSNFRWPWLAPSTTRRPYDYHRSVLTSDVDREVRVEIDKYGRGTVDLSWRGYTGENVKAALMSLPESNRSQVTRLILDGNSIHFLPVLTFPVELEYTLQELSLNHNPVSPPYLTRFTRFELSRLGRLRTLNMSHCGLRSIDMPNLPSLEVLDLSYNDLTYLPPSLGRLDGLSYLFLRGNRLTYISDSPLSSLINLWGLDLGENGLQEIWGQPLQNLVSLMTVKLDNNQLKSLPLLDTKRTKYVYLANNSLQCSCDLMQSIQIRQIQDEYFETCQDGESTISLEDLKLWPEKYQRLCDQGWWGRGSSAWVTFVLWCDRNSDAVVTAIFQVVGVTMVVALLVVLHKKRRRLTGKVKPKGIPYDVLDDQQVSTVSGPQSNV